MPLPSNLLTTTCDIYRPFGAGSPLQSMIACRLVANLPRGRGAQSATNYLTWTHYLDLDYSVDIRDGCTRTAGANSVTYADGDEVRVPTGAGTSRYVVVWVETINRGSAQPFKRAYLIRHAAVWPGP